MSELNTEIKNAIDSLDVDKARELLRDALKSPNAETYYLASLVAITDEQKQKFLNQAIELDPFHKAAHKELNQSKTPNKPLVPHTTQATNIKQNSLGTVKIIGSNQWFAVQPHVVIFIDNQEHSRLKLIDNISIELPAGNHTIYAKLHIRVSNTLSFKLNANSTISFELSTNRMWGTIHLKQL